MNGAELAIWNNIKMYLATNATCLLDTILCVINENATDPMERYKNFPVEFNKHFNLLDFSLARNNFSMPFVGMSMETLNQSGCSSEILIDFQIQYHNVSPTNCSMDCGKCIGASPEAMLQFKADIIRGIDLLFDDYEIDPDGLMHKSDVFDKMRCAEIPNAETGDPETWCQNIVGRAVQEPQIGRGIVRDEINQFNYQRRLEIDGVYGAGYCSGDDSQCISC